MASGHNRTPSGRTSPNEPRWAPKRNVEASGTMESSASQYLALARFAALCLLLATAWTLAGCQNQDDDKAVAVDVASAWVDSSIDEVSSAIAELVIRERPAAATLAAGAISGLIRERLSWDYSEPVRLREGRYRVTATAVADITVQIPPLVNANYMVTMPFNLDVDTDNKEVVSWLPDLNSAAVASN